MNENEWLQSLQPGVEVAVTSSRSFSRFYRFSPVERLTPTQIIVAGRRFARRDGREIGKGYRGDFLVEATAELKAEIAREARRNELLARVRDVRWSRLPDETLESVVALLDSTAIGE